MVSLAEKTVLCLRLLQNSKVRIPYAVVHLSHVMRKPAFCICENKGADQLPVEVTTQLICYIDSTVLLFSKSEISSLAIFCGCTARFVSDLVGNSKVRFSNGIVHFISRQDGRLKSYASDGALNNIQVGCTL